MLGKALKIVFWGEDSFSDIVLNSLLEAGYHVCAVITPFMTILFTSVLR